MISRMFILFFAVICHAHSYKLPAYIKACSAKDPNVGDCVRSRMIELIPRFVKGNAALHIPVLSPFHLDEIVIEATKTLTLKLHDIDIFGLENAKVGKLVIDLKNMKSTLDLTFPVLTVIGTYDVDGQIMVLPIKGHGPLNVTAINADFHFAFNWTFEEKNGVPHGKIESADLSYSTESTYFKFDNLFNGNKELGDQVNRFINENAKDLSKDISPAVSDTIKTIVVEIFTSVSAQVPYNELFLP